MAWYKCSNGNNGDNCASKLEALEDIYNNNSIIFFDNDERFEVTNNLGAWEIKNLFTYEGQNMYSSPQIIDGQTSYVDIKNITSKTLFIRVVYKSSTEGSGYDYGTISINSVIITTNIGGSVEGVTDVLALSAGATIRLSYGKDGGASGELDNVGMLILELEE